MSGEARPTGKNVAGTPVVTALAAVGTLALAAAVHQALLVVAVALRVRHGLDLWARAGDAAGHDV